jgi:hypothetical protein
LTKIKIGGFPTEIIVERSKGIRWLKPYRQELISYRREIYQAAVTAAEQVNDDKYTNSMPGIPPQDVPDIIDRPIPADEANHLRDPESNYADLWNICDLCISVLTSEEPERPGVDRDALDP